MSIFADLPAPQWRFYDPARIVRGKPMADWLRWSVAFWHSFAWPGADIFGAGTFRRPWMPGQPVTPERAAMRLDAAFDFLKRVEAPFFAFHDADVMADYDGIADYDRRFGEAVEGIGWRMEASDARLLWGTANLFGHPRYAAGASTNPDPAVFGWAAHQVRRCLEATHALGGANYVLWGGREGYDTLLNTDLKREMAQMGRFLSMVVDHKHRIGFTGQIMLEPKPHEPMKHQYDRDVATCFAFLKAHGLEGEVTLNIEANHATLAGSSFEHEVAMADALGVLGSIDINRGDPQNGWDTDQFPNNHLDLVPVMTVLLERGGLGAGGFNFDAKVRRQSMDPQDLLDAHVFGVDCLARALLAAERLLDDGALPAFRAARYAGWDGEAGRAILAGERTLAEVADAAMAAPEPEQRSGRQEWCEEQVNVHG